MGMAHPLWGKKVLAVSYKVKTPRDLKIVILDTQVKQKPMVT